MIVIVQEAEREEIERWIDLNLSWLIGIGDDLGIYGLSNGPMDEDFSFRYLDLKVSVCNLNSLAKAVSSGTFDSVLVTQSGGSIRFDWLDQLETICKRIGESPEIVGGRWLATEYVSVPTEGGQTISVAVERDKSLVDLADQVLAFPPPGLPIHYRMERLANLFTLFRGAAAQNFGRALSKSMSVDEAFETALDLNNALSGLPAFLFHDLRVVVQE